MSSDRRTDRIARQKDGDFSDKERQEIRYVTGKLLYGDDGLDIEGLAQDQQRIRRAWKILGPVVEIASNWKLMLMALAAAVFFGGQVFIDNVVSFLEGSLP